MDLLILMIVLFPHYAVENLLYLKIATQSSIAQLRKKDIFTLHLLKSETKSEVKLPFIKLFSLFYTNSK